MEQKKKHSELEADISLGAAILAVSSMVILIIITIISGIDSIDLEWMPVLPLGGIMALWPWASLTAIVSGVLGAKDGQSRKKTRLGIAGGALALVLGVVQTFILMAQLASAFR